MWHFRSVDHRSFVKTACKNQNQRQNIPEFFKRKTIINFELVFKKRTLVNISANQIPAIFSVELSAEEEKKFIPPGTLRRFKKFIVYKNDVEQMRDQLFVTIILLVIAQCHSVWRPINDSNDN